MNLDRRGGAGGQQPLAARLVRRAGVSVAVASVEAGMVGLLKMAPSLNAAEVGVAGTGAVASRARAQSAPGTFDVCASATPSGGGRF